jgi:hypothetical protein
VRETQHQPLWSWRSINDFEKYLCKPTVPALPVLWYALHLPRSSLEKGLPNRTGDLSVRRRIAGRSAQSLGAIGSLGARTRENMEPPAFVPPSVAAATLLPAHFTHASLAAWPCEQRRIRCRFEFHSAPMTGLSIQPFQQRKEVLHDSLRSALSVSASRSRDATGVLQPGGRRRLASVQDHGFDR